MPRTGSAAPLKDGDVIAVGDTSAPPDFDSLLNATNRGLTAIPRGNLKTAIDESYTAVGGLGSDLSRLVKGATQIAVDADTNLDSLVTLIDRSAPVLDSQATTPDAIQAWAAHLATITGQLRSHDAAVAGILHNGAAAADQGRQLFQRLQPTLPLLLANLASIGQVALTYQPALEQLLVLLPQAVAVEQGTQMGNLNTKQSYRGLYLDFHLNLNLPPTCATGFLPPQQRRAASFEDYPDRPPGDLYCRVPQDSPFNIRGARNYPCLTVPGKRAPTVKMCESDEKYVPLNDGYNLERRPQRHPVGSRRPAATAGGSAAARRASSRDGPPTDRPSRVRPVNRQLRRPRRARVQPVQFVPNRAETPDLAVDVGAADGQLAESRESLTALSRLILAKSSASTRERR